MSEPYVSDAEIMEAYRREQAFEREVIGERARLERMTDAQLSKLIDYRPGRGNPWAANILRDRRNLRRAKALKIGDRVKAFASYTDDRDERVYYHGPAEIIAVAAMRVRVLFADRGQTCRVWIEAIMAEAPDAE